MNKNEFHAKWRKSNGRISKTLADKGLQRFQVNTRSPG